MFQLRAAAALMVCLAGPAMAQSGGAEPTARTRPPAGPLPPIAGSGQSPSQAAKDNRPNYDRAPVYAHPEADPDKAGNAASDGSAGLNSLQSPEPKAGGGG